MARGDRLLRLRKQIDELDDRIVDLLNHRAKAALAIGEIKRRANDPIYAPGRERQVLTRVQRRNHGPLKPEGLRVIYQEIMSASRALESTTTVAYLGPEATFTHAAARRHFGASSELRPCRSIVEVFDAVERRRVDYGVVPIENSTEGVVGSTLDRLVASDVTLSAEVILPVHHHLLTKSGEMKGITRVVSHPQALAQCRGWLLQNLPKVEIDEVGSTAQAAQLAAKRRNTAAIASEHAAFMYRLLVAARHIEDARTNVTRFVVLGYDEPAPTGTDRTSVVFALRDEPGILLRALLPFAKSNINLSRIESRPSRKKAWDYIFFIDLAGHREDAKVHRALTELERACAFVKVLGSYPQGA